MTMRQAAHYAKKRITVEYNRPFTRQDFRTDRQYQCFTSRLKELDIRQRKDGSGWAVTGGAGIKAGYGPGDQGAGSPAFLTPDLVFVPPRPWRNPIHIFKRPGKMQRVIIPDCLADIANWHVCQL